MPFKPFKTMRVSAGVVCYGDLTAFCRSIDPASYRLNKITAPTHQSCFHGQTESACLPKKTVASGSTSSVIFPLK
jgi:hypothetical protein